MLKIKNLYKKFNLAEGLFARYGSFIYAVSNVNLIVKSGETYGLVGESGCGKSTLSKIIAGIHRKDSGKIIISLTDKKYNQGEESGENKKTLREAIRYIFQDPSRSLDPRMSVLNIITEGLRYTSLYRGKKDAIKKAGDVLEIVGLQRSDLHRRPAEFSGGQRQRISIARALITDPELLICDEVVSALDVSVQSQILNVLLDIKEKRNLTMIFISHDLGLVSYMSDRVGVMYGGMIVEEADSLTIMKEPIHPYTQLLYSSILENKIDIVENISEVTNVVSSVKHCVFYNRCPKRTEQCRLSIPEPTKVGENHFVSCFNIPTI